MRNKPEPVKRFNNGGKAWPRLNLYYTLDDLPYTARELQKYQFDMKSGSKLALAERPLAHPDTEVV